MKNLTVHLRRGVIASVAGMWSLKKTARETVNLLWGLPLRAGPDGSVLFSSTRCFSFFAECKFRSSGQRRLPGGWRHDAPRRLAL